MLEPAYGRVERSHSHNNNTAAREVRRSPRGNEERPKAIERAGALVYESEATVAANAVAANAEASAEPQILPESWRLHFRRSGVPERSLTYRVGKRVLDTVGAVALAILFSPLIIAVTLALHRNGGSVIYRHRRVGRDGRIFECLKFRTMVPDADRMLYSCSRRTKG